MTELQIDTQKEPSGVIILRLNGKIDAYSCRQLDDEFSRHISQGAVKFIIDLSLVDYINSAGVGVFLGAREQVRNHNGNIILVNPQPGVVRVFNMLGLTNLFQVQVDCASALTLLDAKTRLLVVDEEPLMTEVLTRFLSKKNYEVTSFTNPAQALEYLKTNRVNLLITELELPGMDGQEFITAARQLVPKLRVLVMSASFTPVTKDELKQMGVTDYYHKFFGLPYLEKIIEHILGKA